jgi:hypothetical protein
MANVLDPPYYDWLIVFDQALECAWVLQHNIAALGRSRKTPSTMQSHLFCNGETTRFMTWRGPQYGRKGTTSPYRSLTQLILVISPLRTSIRPISASSPSTFVVLPLRSARQIHPRLPAS